MAKDPAFLFYPGDWQGGTMHMTHLEKGCYLDLLMLQFNRGKFTEAQAKHMLQSSFDLVWSTIQEKFICENGLYWNQRLATEKEKRSKFTESRRNNATKEKEDKPSEKHMLKHTDKRMEDENINENKDVNVIEIKEENKKFKKPRQIEGFDFSEFGIFIPLVEKWIEYKNSRKENYKSQVSLNAFVKILIKYSENKFENAENIIEQSMANNWAGIFKPKPEFNKFENKDTSIKLAFKDGKSNN